MKDTRLNRFCWHLGRVIGFAWYPALFLIVAYVAWVTAKIVGGN